MKIINLLPENEVKELQLRLASNQLLKFFVVIFISLAICFTGALVMRFYIEGSIAQTKVEVANLQQQLSSSNNQALEKQVKALNTQIRNVKAIDQQHYYWSKALVELSNVTPAGMHIDVVSADRASGQIQISGVADKRDLVLQFWSNVKKSNLFANIDFPLNNLERPTNTSFSFTFYVNTSVIATP